MEESKFSRFFYKIGKTYGKSVDWTEIIVKSTEKSSCKNKYRTSCNIYQYFFFYVAVYECKNA